MTGCFCSHFRSPAVARWHLWNRNRSEIRGISEMDPAEWVGCFGRISGSASAWLTCRGSSHVFFFVLGCRSLIILNTFVCYFFRQWSVDLTSWVSRFAQQLATESYWPQHCPQAKKPVLENQGRWIRWVCQPRILFKPLLIIGLSKWGTMNSLKSRVSPDFLFKHVQTKV